jgi:hypothetical protein
MYSYSFRFEIPPLIDREYRTPHPFEKQRRAKQEKNIHFAICNKAKYKFHSLKNRRKKKTLLQMLIIYLFLLFISDRPKYN